MSAGSPRKDPALGRLTDLAPSPSLDPPGIPGAVGRSDREPLGRLTDLEEPSASLALFAESGPVVLLGLGPLLGRTVGPERLIDEDLVREGPKEAAAVSTAGIADESELMAENTSSASPAPAAAAGAAGEATPSADDDCPKVAVDGSAEEAASLFCAMAAKNLTADNLSTSGC